MNIPKDEIISVLAQFNPWWRGEDVSDLPTWSRAAFGELYQWVYGPPAPRAVLLSGARQVGKTTLMLQVISRLLADGVSAANILYATFDHPIIKLAGIDQVLAAWREREPRVPGPEYLFLDEAQFMRDSDVWIKHQVDFVKDRHIAFTGSAMPLIKQGRESGVGRWHTIRITTLSFYEYLQIKQVNLPQLPQLESLQKLFLWQVPNFSRVSEIAAPYLGHFQEYLIRGGFPQTALVDSLQQAQKLMREDIIDKVLKRDMTALFGVRRVLDLEQVFIYLCMHSGGLIDMNELCSSLQVSKQTAQNYIDLLEATHLIYRLPPYGYGKQVLRAQYKIYLADPAIASSVLMRGKSLLENPIALGEATETAVFKHLYARYYDQSVRFSYWRGKNNNEVDLVAEVGDGMIPFEVKYRNQHNEARDFKGLIELCKNKELDRAYVVTKALSAFGPVLGLEKISTQIMYLPAALLCYWMGEQELLGGVG